MILHMHSDVQITGLSMMRKFEVGIWNGGLTDSTGGRTIPLGDYIVFQAEVFIIGTCASSLK